MPAPRLVMAVDGGGSSTTVCLATAAQILAETKGAASNPAQVGVSGCLEAITDATRHTLQHAGVNRVDEVIVGLAGIEAIDCREQIAAQLQSQFDLGSVRVVTDIELLLFAVAGPTIALISGTGSVCIGRSSPEQILRVGGRGYLVGDEGSGYWLGQQGIAAALRGVEQLGPVTSIASVIAEMTGSEDASVWTQYIYGDPQPRQRIASFAPEVLRLAGAGDRIAGRIVNDGAEHLAGHVSSVMNGLDLHSNEYTLLLAGSVLAEAELLRDTVINLLQQGGNAPSRTVVISDPAQLVASQLASTADG